MGASDDKPSKHSKGEDTRTLEPTQVGALPVTGNGVERRLTQSKMMRANRQRRSASTMHGNETEVVASEVQVGAVPCTKRCVLGERKTKRDERLSVATSTSIAEQPGNRTVSTAVLDESQNNGNVHVKVPKAQEQNLRGLSDDDTEPEESTEDDVATSLDEDPRATMVPSSFQSDSNLFVATPVDDSKLDLPVAEQYDENQAEAISRERRRKTATKIATFLCVGLLLVAVIVFFSMFLAGNFHISFVGSQPTAPLAASPTESPTPSPTSVESYIRQLLPVTTIKKVESSVATPQALAFDWLLVDKSFYGDWLSDSRLLTRFALVCLFFATGGETTWPEDTAKDWLSHTTHECEWGFSKNGTHGDIFTHLDSGTHYYSMPDSPCPTKPETDEDDLLYEWLWLPSSGLEGEIPEELYLLSSLRVLSLFANHLEGTISPSIAALTKLEALALQTNDLSGAIPEEIGKCTNLKTIVVHSNHLEGSLPSTIGQLESLEHLWTEENHLEGAIPTEVGELSKLQYLYLQHNYFSEIPSELGKCSALQELYIFANELHGQLPSEFGLLAALVYLSVHTNMFTGHIPSELGQLSLLEIASVATNSFEGAIPSELGLMTSLMWFHAHENHFSGLLPSELSQWHGVEQVTFSDNHLSGTIPDFSNWHAAEILSFRDNAMSGSVPSWFGQLEGLSKLWLQGNNFTNGIPSELGNAVHLEELKLSSNFLSGLIPSVLGLLPDLYLLLLDSNQLTGSIPVALSGAVHMEDLSLANNRFTGTIPEDIAALENLYYFNLSGNAFSGVLPPQLCALEEFDIDCSDLLCGCSCGNIGPNTNATNTTESQCRSFVGWNITE